MKDLIKLLKASGLHKDELFDLELNIPISEEDLKRIEAKSEKVEEKKITMRERLFPDLYSMHQKSQQVTSTKSLGIPFPHSPPDFAREERKKRR